MTATVVAGQEVETVAADIAEPARPPRRWLPWALLAVSAVCYVIGERSIPDAGPSQWGLIGATSPAYPIAIALVVVAFTIAIRQANVVSSAIATICLVLVLQLPRATATDMPMYSWTYKHLGVVDYIQHSGGLAWGLDIYNGWPGLFALTAWFSDLTGVPPIVIAHWWTPCFHLALVAMVFGVARAWGLAPLHAVTAMFMVAALNWVAQDYFSPQSVGLFLSAAIIALLGLSRERRTGVCLIIVLFAAVNLTHPLTPYWVALLIGLLVISRNMRPWWILFPLAALLAGQLWLNWDQVSDFKDHLSLDFFRNLQTNLGRFHFDPVFGQRVVGWGNRAMAVALWGATALTLLYRWRRKQPFFALAVLSFTGMCLVGGLDYGGESIFRVYLYCLMGCSLVLAPVVVAILQGGLRGYTAAVCVLLIAISASVMGNTGSWFANVMPKNQVETSEQVLAQAELPAYITEAAPNWPERSTWRYANYMRFKSSFDQPMIFKNELIKRHFNTDEDYEWVIKALDGRQDASTYLIITDQMQVYCWYFGILPWDALPNLKARLYADRERWEPFFEGEGVTVFVHKIRPSGSPDPVMVGNAAQRGRG
ncbi:hypothetical protein [Mycobacterium sp. OAE908]|uniref:hypothetical protein n=1 Tax=Mycobacterium sp. OAE908 TaxID=2817899 RepID=UPI001AEB57ED